MARVKTSARTYRLGCGCIQEFSSLPAVGSSPVLCGICRRCTVVSFRYPDSCCGVSCRTNLPAGGVVRVHCTLDPGHDTRHFDKTVNLEFDLPDKKHGRTHPDG